jgi:hypothetical protein
MFFKKWFKTKDAFKEIHQFQAKTDLEREVKSKYNGQQGMYIARKKDSDGEGILVVANLSDIVKNNHSLRLDIYPTINNKTSFSSVHYQGPIKQLYVHNVMAQIYRKGHGRVLIRSLREVAKICNEIILTREKHMQTQLIEQITGKIEEEKSVLTHEELIEFYRRVGCQIIGEPGEESFLLKVD